MLSGHGIVDRVKTRLIWDCLDNRLKPVLQLLVVKTEVRRNGWLSVLLLLTISYTIMRTQPLELLSSRGGIDKLLLQTLLFLCKVEVLSQKLGI